MISFQFSKFALSTNSHICQVVPICAEFQNKAKAEKELGWGTGGELNVELIYL